MFHLKNNVIKTKTFTNITVNWKDLYCCIHLWLSAFIADIRFCETAFSMKSAIRAMNKVLHLRISFFTDRLFQFIKKNQLNDSYVDAFNESEKLYEIICDTSNSRMVHQNKVEKILFPNYPRIFIYFFLKFICTPHIKWRKNLL